MFARVCTFTAAVSLATASILPVYGDVPLSPSPSTSLGETWESWKSGIPDWADYMPGVVLFRNVGRMGTNISVAIQKLRNFRSYDRYCGELAPFHQQPFCQSVRPTLRKNEGDFIPHSPLWILLDSLIDRAGSTNPAAIDAAKLLLTIRTLIGYPEDSSSDPDLMIGYLYPLFANCVPNSCQVAVTRPEGMYKALQGLLAYFTTYGGEVDLQAVKLMHKAGF